jgi:hypothetical protein
VKGVTAASDGSQPRRQHRREGWGRSGEIRGRRAPNTDGGAARERLLVGREAPVMGSQGDDTGSSLLAHGNPGVVLRQTMGGQIVVISRIEGRAERRKAVYEYIVRGLGGGRRRRAGGSRDMYVVRFDMRTSQSL